MAFNDPMFGEPKVGRGFGALLGSLRLLTTLEQYSCAGYGNDIFRSTNTWTAGPTGGGSTAGLWWLATSKGNSYKRLAIDVLMNSQFLSLPRKSKME